jgi:hypothetical protein
MGAGAGIATTVLTKYSEYGWPLAGVTIFLLLGILYIIWRKYLEKVQEINTLLRSHAIETKNTTEKNMSEQMNIKNECNNAIANMQEKVEKQLKEHAQEIKKLNETKEEQSAKFFERIEEMRQEQLLMSKENRTQLQDINKETTQTLRSIVSAIGDLKQVMLHVMKAENNGEI